MKNLGSIFPLSIFSWEERNGGIWNVNSIPLNFASQCEHDDGYTFLTEIPEDCCAREDSILNMLMPLKPLIFIPIFKKLNME